MPTSFFLLAAEGGETISGTAGDDALVGGAGNDVLRGGRGNDSFASSAGADTFSGGAGDDVFIVDRRQAYGEGDRFIGGDGFDRIVVEVHDGAGSLLFLFDRFFHAANAGIERLDVLGTSLPVLAGTEANERWDLRGMEHRLTHVLLMGGDDVFLADAPGTPESPLGMRIAGGTGRDRIATGAGADTVQGEAGADSLSGGDGDDWLGALMFAGEFRLQQPATWERGNDTIQGGAGNDTIDGGDGNDSLSGGDGDDLLLYRVANDYLRAQAGRDSFSGGAGHDVIQLYAVTGPGSFEFDGFFFSGLARRFDNRIASIEELRGVAEIVGSDLAEDWNFSGLRAGIEDGGVVLPAGAALGLVPAGEPAFVPAAIRLEGGNDRFHGTDFDESVFGGDGADRLHGGRGRDTVYGEDGNDTLIAADDGDVLYGGTGQDRFVIIMDGSAGPLTVEIRDWLVGEDHSDVFGSPFPVREILVIDVPDPEAARVAIASPDELIVHATVDGAEVLLGALSLSGMPRDAFAILFPGRSVGQAILDSALLV